METSSSSIPAMFLESSHTQTQSNQNPRETLPTINMNIKLILAASLAVIGLLDSAHSAVIYNGTAMATGSMVPDNAVSATGGYSNTASVNGVASTTTHYSFRIGAVDSVTGDPVPISSIADLSLSLSRTGTVGQLNVPLNGAIFAPAGSGLPVFRLYNSAGMDITASVYGQTVGSTTLPADVTWVLVDDVVVSPGVSGGVYNLNAPGQVQTLALNAIVSTGNTTVGPTTFTATTQFNAIPEPGAVLLGSAGFALLGIFRRRRS